MGVDLEKQMGVVLKYVTMLNFELQYLNSFGPHQPFINKDFTLTKVRILRDSILQELDIIEDRLQATFR